SRGRVKRDGCHKPERAVAIWEGADGADAALDLAVQSLEAVRCLASITPAGRRQLLLPVGLPRLVGTSRGGRAVAGSRRRGVGHAPRVTWSSLPSSVAGSCRRAG